MSKAVRLAFVDDHPVLLKGMVAIFDREPGYEVVGQGSSADEALQIAHSEAPDVLFMDLSMPGDVFAAIAEISRTQAATRVVVLTAFSSVDSMLKALSSGARGFVIKGGRVNEIIEAIDAVMRGEMVSPRQALERRRER